MFTGEVATTLKGVRVLRECVGSSMDSNGLSKPRHMSQQTHNRATDQLPPWIRNDDDIPPEVQESSDYF